MKNKGYSLLELIFTLAILGILMSIVVPNFSDYYRSLNTSEFADRLTMDISYARDYTAARGKNFQCLFDKDEHTYSFVVDPDGTDEPLFLPSTSTMEGSLPPGFTMAFEGDSPLEVTFTEQGIPVVDENITLTITGGGVTRTIIIDHKTGLVTLE